MFSRFHSAAEHEALVDGFLKSRRIQSQIELFKEYRQLGIKTLEQASAYEAAKKTKDPKEALESILQQFSQAYPPTANSTYAFGEKKPPSSGAAMPRKRGRPPSIGSAARRTVSVDKNDEAKENDLAAAAVFHSIKQSDYKLKEDIVKMANAPGADLLSDTELELCVKVPFPPHHYLAAKEAILRFVVGSLIRNPFTLSFY